MSNHRKNENDFRSSSFGKEVIFGHAKAFDASTGLGSSLPPFGSSGFSIFGRKPAFGGFASSCSQTGSFLNTFQQPQPSVGSNRHGFSAHPFGASSQHASNTLIFGSATMPAFGSTTTTSGVCSSAPFGSANAAFGGTATTAPFSFGSTISHHPTSLRSTPFGGAASPFGAQSSPPCAPKSTPSFRRRSTSRGRRFVQRIPPYIPTPEVKCGTGAQPGGMLQTIVSMPALEEECVDNMELDYCEPQDECIIMCHGRPTPEMNFSTGAQTGAALHSKRAIPDVADMEWEYSKVVPNPPCQPTSGTSFVAAQSISSAFGTNLFGQKAGNSHTTPSNPSGPKTPTFGPSGFVAPSTTTAVNSSSSTSSTFGTTANPTASICGPSPTPPFEAFYSPSIFSASTTPAFGVSPSVFNSSAVGSTDTTFGTESYTPCLGQTSDFGQTTPAFTQFGQTNLSSTPSGFAGNLFTTIYTPGGFGQTVTSGAFCTCHFGQMQRASSGLGGMSNVFGPGTFGQSAASQGNMAMQPARVTNPFGILPPVPQMFIGRAAATSSVQHGMSSIPAAGKPAPLRISPLLSSRQLSSLRRIRWPTRKYCMENDGVKVPFEELPSISKSSPIVIPRENPRSSIIRSIVAFYNDELSSTPKADAFFIPRENPRALVIRPVEQWPPRTNWKKQSLLKDMPSDNGNESVAKDGFEKHQNASPVAEKQNGIHEDHVEKVDSCSTISGQSVGADIESIMPKLRHSDYYTEPRIQELAAKERVEPGYCREVKDFVVGRHDYGRIKFHGKTDVRRLNLDAIIQFNNREVTVYTDDNKKPPVGQGLNKPAEITLLNIRFFNKQTGEQCTEGPKTEWYRQMLRNKCEQQGAEFISFDPVLGEWKFRLNHF